MKPRYWAFVGRFDGDDECVMSIENPSQAGATREWERRMRDLAVRDGTPNREFYLVAVVSALTPILIHLPE